MKKTHVENDSEALGGSSVKQKAAELIAEAERLVNIGSQAEAAMKLAPRIYLASPASLKEMLTQLNSSNLAEPPKQMARKMMLKRLAKREPIEAMRFALEVSGRPEWLFPEVFQQWVDKDALAAEAWYSRVKASGEFPTQPAELERSAQISVIGAIANRDLDEALEVIAAVDDGEASSRDAMLIGLRRSLTDSVRWSQLANRAVAHENPQLKESLLVVLSDRAFVFDSVGEQLERIDRLGLRGEELHAFAITALRGAPRNNSAPLAQWGLDRLPDELIEKQVGQLVASWARSDRTAAEAWIESLPPGEAQEVALRAISR